MLMVRMAIMSQIHCTSIWFILIWTLGSYAFATSQCHWSRSGRRIGMCFWRRYCNERWLNEVGAVSSSNSYDRRTGTLTKSNPISSLGADAISDDQRRYLTFEKHRRSRRLTMSLIGCTSATLPRIDHLLLYDDRSNKSNSDMRTGLYKLCYCAALNLKQLATLHIC